MMPYLRIFNAVCSLFDFYVPIADLMCEGVSFSLILLVEVSLIGVLTFTGRR